MKTTNNFFKDLDKIATQIPVSEIMVKNVKYVKDTDTAQKAIDLMAEHSISGLIVCDKKDFPVGMISEGDLLKKVFSKGKNPKKTKIKQVMSKGLVTIKPDLNIGEISVLMRKKKISKLPVVENKKIIGYVTKSDLLDKLYEIYYQNRKLVWLSVMLALQFIIIAVLVWAYVNNCATTLSVIP